MKKIILSLITLILTACANRLLMRNPPNVNYNLSKVDALIYSNLIMYAAEPVSKNQIDGSNEIKFKLAVKNMDNSQNVELDFSDAKFVYMETSKKSLCAFANQSDGLVVIPGALKIVECTITFAKADALTLGKNDLLGELRIPLKNKLSKFVSAKIFIRNEEL